MDFLLPFDWEIQKRICKTILVKHGLLFAKYACACKTTVLKDSFSNPFSDFPIEWWKWKSKNRYLSVEIRFRISNFAFDCKSQIQILKSKSRFPNQTNACTLVPTVFQWHGKREFKCHFHFSFSHDIEKQIWILLFVFHFRPNFEKRFCTSYFVFRFRITLKNGYQFQFSFFVFAARSDKNVCKITTRENGNVYHRVTALLIPRSGRQRPGFLAYPPPSGE